MILKVPKVPFGQSHLRVIVRNRHADKSLVGFDSLRCCVVASEVLSVHPFVIDRHHRHAVEQVCNLQLGTEFKHKADLCAGWDYVKIGANVVNFCVV